MQPYASLRHEEPDSESGARDGCERAWHEEASAGPAGMRRGTHGRWLLALAAACLHADGRENSQHQLKEAWQRQEDKTS